MSMNFRRREPEAPEINLIPFIDVLLVILIFLMLSTTYAKFTELKVTLPTADAQRAQTYPKEVLVAVTNDGRYAVDHQPVAGNNIDALTAALAQAAGGDKNRMVVIAADGAAAHQSVIAVMDAARRAGLQQLTFATQAAQRGAADNGTR